MLLAWMLLRWDNIIQIAAFHQPHHCDAPGPSPVFSVLISLNAPLAVPRSIWEELLYRSSSVIFAYYLSNALFIAAIGLFWYFVARNLDALRERRAILMFTWPPVRFAVDAVLVVLSLIPGLLGASAMRDAVRYWPSNMHAQGCYGPLWFHQTASLAIACLLLGWCFLVTFFYGRDFILCARGRSI